MKKAKKIALLIAALLIVAGFILSIAALSFVKFDISELNTTKLTTKTHEVDKDFQNIRISADVYDVRLLPSKDNRCKVVCAEGTDVTCTVAVEGDTLVIEQTDQRDWWKYIGFNWQERKLIVYLPKTQYNEFTMESMDGDVEIPEDFAFTEVSIHNTSGDISFGAAVKETLSMETVSGDLELQNVTAKNIELQSISGDIECLRVMAQEQMRMESTSGEIELKRCDAATMFLKTVSGDVEGTLLSGKMFEIDTVSGDVEIPVSSTGGTCRIETISGDIEIEARN